MLYGNLILTNKTTLKDWFYLELVSDSAITGIIEIPQKEMHVCLIDIDCSWQLRFDKKVKILYQTYSFCNWWWFVWPKVFNKVKIGFYLVFILLTCSLFKETLWKFASLHHRCFHDTFQNHYSNFKRIYISILWCRLIKCSCFK